MNTKTITKALKIVVPKNATLPICESVQFTGKNVIATDLDVSVSIPFDTPMPFVANANDVFNMWEAFGEGYELNVTHLTLNVESHGTKLILPLNTYDEFPGVPCIPTECAPILFKEADVNMLSTAVDFLGNDPCRIAFSHVCLRNGKMYATNTHMAMFYPLQSEGITDDVFISVKAKQLMQLWAGDWTIHHNETNTFFHNKEGVVITTRTMDERYPDIEQVIPKENPIELKFIVNEFNSIVRTGVKFGDKGNRVTVHCADGKTRLTFADEDRGTSFEKALLLSDSVGDISIGFNHKLFDRIVKHCGNKAVLQMSAPNRAIVVNEYFLIMPVMIQNEQNQNEEVKDEEEIEEEETINE